MNYVKLKKKKEQKCKKKNCIAIMLLQWLIRYALLPSQCFILKTMLQCQMGTKMQKTKCIAIILLQWLMLLHIVAISVFYIGNKASMSKESALWSTKLFLKLSKCSMLCALIRTSLILFTILSTPVLHPRRRCFSPALLHASSSHHQPSHTLQACSHVSSGAEPVILLFSFLHHTF